MKFRMTALVAGSLALAACGSADDASTEAQPDSVEMPANTALEGVDDVPVEDSTVAEDTARAPSTTTTATAEPTVTEREAIDEAGDEAAATAAAAADALAEE